MTERPLFWLPLAVLAALALLTFWLAQTIKEAGARNGISAGEPDSIVENFQAISTDKSGAPRYRLSASRLRHFSDSEATLLDAPSLTQVQSRSGELKVVSSQASISPGGEKVEFTGDVRLSRQTADGKGNVSMKTTYLEVLPEKGLASTSKPVLIEQPGMVVNANGLRLSANTRVLKLTGRVKVQYQGRRRA